MTGSKKYGEALDHAAVDQAVDPLVYRGGRNVQLVTDAGEGSVAVLAQLSDYINIRFVQISLKFRAH